MKVSKEVLNILDEAKLNGNTIELTSGQLDRKTYMAVNKVLEAMGGKWNRKEGGHVFSDDPTEILEGVLQTGEIVDAKQYFQAFNTPDELSERLVKLAEVQDDHVVLEPSAGEGAILRHLRGNVHFCEIQQKLYEKLCVMEFDGDLFPMEMDFLQFNPGPIYDRIIANPPFTRQQDIDHVTHMIECCKPDGRVVSVMSNSVTFRTNSKTTTFKKLLADCRRYEWHEIPAGSFKKSGTMVSATILVVDK